MVDSRTAARQLPLLQSHILPRQQVPRLKQASTPALHLRPRLRQPYATSTSTAVNQQYPAPPPVADPSAAAPSRPGRHPGTRASPPSPATPTPTLSQPSAPRTTTPSIIPSMRDPDSTPPLTEQTTAYNATETLFKECARQADYVVPQAFQKRVAVPKGPDGEDIGEGTGWWYETLALAPTFSTWAQVTFVHLWLLTARLRFFAPEYSKIWMQTLHDHFFFEAEHRMALFHGVSSGMIRQRYLKEWYNLWRGVLGAYDEGLAKGDAVLAAAVWRNVFKARDDVDWRHVALVVSFMRRGLQGMDNLGDKVVVEARVRFGTPATESAVLEVQADGMSEGEMEDDAVVAEEMGKIAEEQKELARLMGKEKGFGLFRR